MLKAFPWDVGAAMAMSVVGVLIAMFFERSPVLAFVLILFALCGYIVLQRDWMAEARDVDKIIKVGAAIGDKWQPLGDTPLTEGHGDGVSTAAVD